MRVLSGIQPSGNLHLGNYFGAIKQQIELQDKAECFFFIADYHALTSLKDPLPLKRYTREVAAAYIALGLDPTKAVLFRQSDVPLTTELAWILGCTTGTSQFLRAHAYKDKVANGLNPNMGLFSYPLLMAADILLYKATHVPVGKDQEQHLEMTCDIAGSFNAAYPQRWKSSTNRGIFPKPQVLLSNSPYVPGTDGRKMSKSYKNTIPIFSENEKTLKKAISAIVTDSKDPSKEPLDPTTCNAFAIYSLFAEPYEVIALEHDYLCAPEVGLKGYGEVKEMIVSKMQEEFGKAASHYYELLKPTSELNGILEDGASRALHVARATLNECRKLVGLD